jgi:hypothetical protein
MSALLDRIEQRLNAVVRVFTSQLSGSGAIKRLESTIGTDVDLNIDKGAIVLDELERMSRVAVHVVVAIWGATITKEDHNLMNRLRVLAEVVPEHVGIFGMPLWVTLLSVDEVGKLGGVTQEEDGGVVEDLRKQCVKCRMLVKLYIFIPQSRFPSSVLILMAKPRGSRAVSADPDSPPTVEKRIVVRAYRVHKIDYANQNIGIDHEPTFVPTLVKNLEEVISERS